MIHGWPVAVLRTSPRTVFTDYHRLLNLARYQEALDRTADTALKINISWHFFYPGSSTTPWQLDGVIRALKRDEFDPALIHACHNRTVVIDARRGERENERGFPELGAAPAEIGGDGLRACLQSLGILGTCLKEAPEFAAHRRRRTAARG